jgi:hypothetical protein
MGMNREQYPLMPDFSQGTASFAHTVDSAVNVFDALGIAESRLTLRMAGPGRPFLEVVRQSPASGTLLTPSVEITLWISGLGFFDALPLPMHESGGEAEIGTRELSRLFDDPLQKTAQWVRAGAPLFDIGSAKFAACRRWLALFGLDPSDWPEELLYPLALLAPALARMAGREAGIKLAFLVLFGIPVQRIDSHPAHRRLDRNQISLFGLRSSRLGRDLIAGDRQIDTEAITIHLGPLALDAYADFQSVLRSRLLRQAADLCVSAYQSYSFHWLVGDAAKAPGLGTASRNGRIGLNFHLGRGVGA